MRKTAIVSAMAASMMMSGLAGTSIMAAGLTAPDGPPPQKRRRSVVAPRPSYYSGPSRYMPHRGTKERARHAGWPDGVMHNEGHIHTANAQAALFDMPKARKPRRVAS